MQHGTGHALQVAGQRPKHYNSVMWSKSTCVPGAHALQYTYWQRCAASSNQKVIAHMATKAQKAATPAATVTVLAPKGRTVAPQAGSNPKGTRGKARYIYPNVAQGLALTPACPATSKGAKVLAYFAQPGPHTYAGLHAICDSAARNAWRFGWVTAAA